MTAYDALMDLLRMVRPQPPGPYWEGYATAVEDALELVVRNAPDPPWGTPPNIAISQPRSTRPSQDHQPAPNAPQNATQAPRKAMP